MDEKWRFVRCRESSVVIKDLLLKVSHGYRWLFIVRKSDWSFWNVTDEATGQSPLEFFSFQMLSFQLMYESFSLLCQVMQIEERFIFRSSVPLWASGKNTAVMKKQAAKILSFHFKVHKDSTEEVSAVPFTRTVMGIAFGYCITADHGDAKWQWKTFRVEGSTDRVWFLFSRQAIRVSWLSPFKTLLMHHGPMAGFCHTWCITDSFQLSLRAAIFTLRLMALE